MAICLPVSLFLLGEIDPISEKKTCISHVRYVYYLFLKSDFFVVVLKSNLCALLAHEGDICSQMIVGPNFFGKLLGLMLVLFF